MIVRSLIREDATYVHLEDLVIALQDGIDKASRIENPNPEKQAGYVLGLRSTVDALMALRRI